MKALFWAFLLLTLIVYVFAILFSQAVYDYISDPTNPPLPDVAQEAANRYFRSLVRSMMLGCSFKEFFVVPFFSCKGSFLSFRINCKGFKDTTQDGAVHEHCRRSDRD